MTTTYAISPMVAQDLVGDYPTKHNQVLTRRTWLDHAHATFATSPYTVTDEHLVIATAAAGAVTINLPAAADVTGSVVYVKVTSVAGGNVTIDADGGELIDGVTTKVLSAQYAIAVLFCDGAAWHLL